MNKYCVQPTEHTTHTYELKTVQPFKMSQWEAVAKFIINRNSLSKMEALTVRGYQTLERQLVTYTNRETC
jgi:hypothetical protein